MLTVDEAAAFLGVHPMSVRRYMDQGRLRYYRLGPRMYRLDMNDVRDLLKEVPAATPEAQQQQHREKVREATAEVVEQFAEANQKLKDM